MFVTIQLKNPSQQDRFSEAQRIDAQGPGTLLPARGLGRGVGPQGWRGRQPTRQSVGEGSQEATPLLSQHPSHRKHSGHRRAASLPDCPGLCPRGHLVTWPTVSLLPLTSQGKG